VTACLAGDAATAARRLATHLSRTALTVFMLAAPEHDPAAIRAALMQVTTQTAEPPDQPRLASRAARTRPRAPDADVVAGSLGGGT